MAVPNLGEILGSTMENYHDTLTDNIFKNRVLLNHMKSNGGVKKYDGGSTIRVPLMYASNSTAAAVTSSTSLDLTYQETVDAAEYAWKQYNVSVTLTREDMLKNSGKSQVINLMEAKISQAENAISELINNDMFNGSASSEITGLDSIIAASGSIGGINGSTQTFWRSYVDSTSEALSIADMRTAKNSANLGMGGKKVSIIVTTQTLFEKYQSLLSASYQMNPLSTGESKRLGDGGFTSVEFEGVPVVFDEAATSGVMYFINTNNFKLGVHKDGYFQPIKKSEPTNQHLAVSHIHFFGNTICDRRASLAKLSAKTA